MRKILGVLGLCGAFACSACDAHDNGAKNGDTVVIDFAGFLNGVQFEGGTAKGFPLVLGSGQFVPGFEEQLVGTKKGDERDVNITFPTQYVPELAGKDVVFKVKVVDIIKKDVAEK
ncbi:MAG: FKBP-type peptidyl-prolyl cis-trans isomerase [Alphaproteobacteria bacterium]|nr:FKBP-type peptidyl-prolyl cis-trans isomerase [Alphaproteobacteria bacterium]